MATLELKLKIRDVEASAQVDGVKKTLEYKVHNNGEEIALPTVYSILPEGLLFDY